MLGFPKMMSTFVGGPNNMDYSFLGNATEVPLFREITIYFCSSPVRRWSRDGHRVLPSAPQGLNFCSSTHATISFFCQGSWHGSRSTLDRTPYTVHGSSCRTRIPNNSELATACQVKSTDIAKVRHPSFTLRLGCPIHCHTLCWEGTGSLWRQESSEHQMPT